MLLLTLFCMSAIFAQAQMWPGIKSGNNPLLSLENQVFLAGTTGPLETGWNWESVLCYDDQNVLSYRYTQTFNAQGDMLTQLIEKQTGNVWTNYIRVTFSWLGGTLISGTTAMWTGKCLAGCCQDHRGIRWAAPGKSGSGGTKLSRYMDQ